jgi:hypothetical protein
VAPGSDAQPQDGGKSLHEVATELWELARDYAKQETIDPLKGLGRFLAFGLGGAIALGIGISMLLLGGLRFVQTETGSRFTGNLSWLPYVFTAVVGVVAITLAVLRISKRKGPGA